MSADLATRFWAKVRKSDGCWEWTAALRPDGYGVIGLGSRSDGVDRAHRVSYRLHFGTIPNGAVLLHLCDNRKCVRPDHLRAGTQQDNVDDMRAKMRHVDPPKLAGDLNPRRIRPPHGSLNPAAKLTEQDVAGARALSTIGVSGAEIGRILGVDKSTACRVVKGATWKA